MFKFSLDYWSSVLTPETLFPSLNLKNAVKSSELKWLPDGSEFVLGPEKPSQDSTSKPKTYTSFNCSQKSLPEFSNDPIAPKHDDIVIAKLGVGQVLLDMQMCKFHLDH